jgi:enoyl-CoA hydratase
VSVERDGAVLVITIDRPERRNAITRRVSELMADALDLLDADDQVAVGVLTGRGGNFSSGMDLKEFVAGERPDAPGRGLGGLVERPPAKPLIAAVEGYALAGGFELVLACDLVVASTEAQFGLPEVTRGIVAASGGLLRLAQRIPRNVAAEAVLTGDRITASRAFDLGLVNRLVEPGQALTAALELGRRIAENGPFAVRTSKQIMYESPAWTPDEMWVRQAELSEPVLASADAREGATAFAQKRRPIWGQKSPTIEKELI